MNEKDHVWYLFLSNKSLYTWHRKYPEMGTNKNIICKKGKAI